MTYLNFFSIVFFFQDHQCHHNYLVVVETHSVGRVTPPLTIIVKINACPLSPSVRCDVAELFFTGRASASASKSTLSDVSSCSSGIGLKLRARGDSHCIELMLKNFGEGQYSNRCILTWCLWCRRAQCEVRSKPAELPEYVCIAMC